MGIDVRTTDTQTVETEFNGRGKISQGMAEGPGLVLSAQGERKDEVRDGGARRGRGANASGMAGPQLLSLPSHLQRKTTASSAYANAMQ